MRHGQQDLHPWWYRWLHQKIGFVKSNVIVHIGTFGTFFFLVPLSRYVFQIYLWWLPLIVMFPCLLCLPIITYRLWRSSFLRLFLLSYLCVSLTLSVELGIVGFLLIQQEGNPLFLRVFISLSILALWLSFIHAPQEAQRWEIARQTGGLKKFLNERQWTICYEDFSGLQGALTQAEELIRKEKGQRRWVRRFWKLTPLVPGGAIMFRRSFGHGAGLIGIFSSILAMLFFWVGISLIPLYFKIRKWEREKEVPLVIVDCALDKRTHRN